MSNETNGTLTSNGVSEIFWISDNNESNDGAFIHIDGDFGDGNVRIEFLLSGTIETGVWKDIAGSYITFDHSEVIRIPNGAKIRLRLSGSTGANLTYQMTNASYRGTYK